MSEVSPQGSYMAKTCPQALQLNVLWPCEPLPTSEFFSMLGDEGRGFEADVFALLAEAVPGAVVVDKTLPRPIREAVTVEALDAGTPLVIGGRLPVDRMALRAGEPDILVRADAFSENTADSGYLAVDVKHHKSLDARTKEDAVGAITSDVSALFDGPHAPDGDLEANWRRDDLLQLAHYQRLLEACGHASGSGMWGGIVGKEERVVWYDLDLPHWKPTPYIEDPPDRQLSTMEVYDLEFSYRLSVIEASLDHQEDPTSPLLAEPIAVSDCDKCGWQEWCFEEMASSGDISLLPGMTVEKRRRYHARGVKTLWELAALDCSTARLVAAKVDLEHLDAQAKGADPSTLVSDLLPRRPKQVERLVGEGICVAADVVRLDALTATFGDAGITDLAKQVDNARALIGPSPAYRRRGIDKVGVPRADIEVDVDMESVNDGCYLWGTLLNARETSGAATSEYVGFASWDPDVAVAEVEAFVAFWEWLTEIRLEARRRGASFRAYCYSQGAENGQLRRLAELCGVEGPVEDFIGSDQWVDLLPVVKDQLITGLRSNGLKTVAPLAGFSWRSTDVGGTLAIVRYMEAIAEDDTALRAEAREWIVSYNEDDVRATAAIREWLDQLASLLPSIEEAGPD